jgi:hypothetical protein
VISTGPYAVVQHSMYAGSFVLLLGTPLALGSYWVNHIMPGVNAKEPFWRGEIFSKTHAEKICRVVGWIVQKHFAANRPASARTGARFRRSRRKTERSEGGPCQTTAC